MTEQPAPPTHPPTAGAGDHVLLTGGCGFIGRSVLPALRERGARVTVLDRQPLPDTGRDDPGVALLAGDLTDPTALDHVPDDVTAVVHLAAITSVLGSQKQPVETYRTNVELTQRLLELARTRGLTSFVLASTNAVTGDVGTRTIDVDLPPAPLTPYGATKAAAEMLAAGYAGSYGLAASALRFTNVYGPGMDAKDSFVPRLMRAALAGTTVSVYGTGEQSRDLVHVDDVVRAVLCALDRRFVGRAVIGSGRSVTVLDLIEQVRAVTGCALPVEHVPAPAGEMPAVRVDIESTRTALGWQPRVGLTEGLAGVWAEFRALSSGPG